MKNQLQFNMSVPPCAAGLALRHQVIDPIIVEKVGAVDGNRVMPPLAVKAGNTFQFQALSQDKLDIAVQLAKRDLKKKKFEDQMGQRSRSPTARDRSRSPSPLSRRGTKIVKSREYRDRLRQQELKKKKANALKIRERVGKGIVGKNMNKERKPAVSKERTRSPPPTLRLPVTTSSPPTRDCNPRRALTKDELQSSEVRRLQTEIQQFLMKIQDLIQRIVDGDMMHDGSVKLRGQDDLHLGEEEGEVRRRLRCEEQATRSARTIYFLKQQVRGIQEDFTRLGPEKILQVKMTQTLTRLASAHRGAVRALQTFVTQLQNQLPREGPPSGCRELTGLVTQLTTLSSQIIQNGQTDTQDMETDAQTTVTLLGHVEDLLAVWEEESRIVQAAHKSPERNVSDRPKQSGPKGTSFHRGVVKKVTKRTAGKYKLQNKGRQQVKSASPERRAALRAGLAAILREDSSAGHMAGSGLGNRVHVREVRFESEPLPADHRGLLLPPHLQRPRPVVPTMGVPSVPSGHFAEPTMSFNLKAVVPQRNPVTEPRASSAPASPSRGRSRTSDPHWLPPGTPAQTPKMGTPRSRSHSPGCLTCASLNASMEDLSLDFFSEKRTQKSPKGHVHFAHSRSRPRSRSPPRRFPVKQSSDDDIARRLEPLYSQSELLTKKQEAAMRANLGQRRNFQMDTDIDHQTRGEVLSELLFNDLLTDTVEEFQALKGENSVTEQAARLMNNPSLEVMVQRLQEMELEQEEIRRRWTSVRFDTEEIRRCAGVDDEPSDPGPLDLPAFSRDKVERSKLGTRQGADVRPILFTKTNKPFRGDRDRQLLPSSANTGDAEMFARLPVTLPEDVVMEIREHVEQYESYLKRTCHHVSGKFDPWQLVKEVSDEILNDCLTEVAGELEDMSSDIVNHLYTSEFAVTTQDPPLAPPLDPLIS